MCWLFEVHESPRPGFKVSMRAGRPVVHMGKDEKLGNHTVLPIGQSIARLLRHHEDHDKDIVLLRATLKETTSGLMLIRQSEEEANAERQALVIVDTSYDNEAGATHVADARGHSAPEFITYSSGDGCARQLYLFRPGDGLFVCWSARALNSDRPKRFIVSWDGSNLRETLCHRGKPRYQRRPRKEQRQASEPRGPEVVRPFQLTES